MAVLFSKKFNIPKDRLKALGVFDVFLDEDSPFFINIKLLEQCKIPEFINSYDRVNRYYNDIGLLLKSASPNDKLYRSAYKKFNFPEVNGINLGFSGGTHGAGFGDKLRGQIIKDAYEIIQKGCVHPELFHLVSLFENNVGPDRLSDMIARIIYPDIVSYSRRVYSELGINQDNYPQYHFKDGILVNPYKKYYLLLLPECILHEIPIAFGWNDISRVCFENEAIRAEINELVSEEWRKMSVPEQKKYLRDHLFKDPEKANRIIEAYKTAKINEFSVLQQIEYLSKYYISNFDIPKSNSNNSYDAALEIVESFKNLVEFHRLNTIINGDHSKLNEKGVQTLIYAVAHMFCNKFNWYLSPETDSGRGAVDFVLSRGNDKTVIEVKLTSNQKCVHGLEVQIEEYAKAENTKNKIFILVKNEDRTDRVNEVLGKRAEMLRQGITPATVVVIDIKPKASASIFNPEEYY